MKFDMNINYNVIKSFVFSTYSFAFHFKRILIFFPTLNIYFKPNSTIRLSEKFLSFHKLMIDEQQFLFYIILSN